MAQAWLDGVIVEAPLPALWRGDGVYETMLWRNGPPPAFVHHVERMAHGAARLGVTAPSEDALRMAIAQALADSADLSRVRVTCLATDQGVPSLLVEARTVNQTELQPPPARVMLGPSVRNPAAWFMGCKHVGIAADLALRRRAAEQGADDVVLRSIDGWLSEATTATLLMGLDDDRVVTPGAAAAPLPGTTLAQMQTAGASVETELLVVGDMPRIRWMLLLNAVCGGRVVSHLADRELAPVPAEWLERARTAVTPP